MELTLKAVPIHRGLNTNHISYVTSLMFADITRLLGDGHLYVPNEEELDDFAQRKLNPSRVSAIAQYILNNYQEGRIFFPPICINIQPAPIYTEGNLLIPYHSVTLRLTDGQHRCFAIQKALDQLKANRSEQWHLLSTLEIGVLLYSALSLEDERQAFRDQNLLVQKPSVSLSHYFDKTSPFVLIAKDLMKRVPQFRKNNIEMVANSLGKQNEKLLTLSTLVTATKYMFPNIKSKENLELITDWAATFWAAAASQLPHNPWQVRSSKERQEQRDNTLLVSSVLFQALGLLGHDFYQQGIPAVELVQWLENLNQLNWQKDHPMWFERGVTQIGNQDKLIISNTKSTVNNCYKILREFTGAVPMTDLVS